jgi:hypothetical protein
VANQPMLKFKARAIELAAKNLGISFEHPS